MIKLYVGTYAKYNNGSIAGQWVDLSDFSDLEEFNKHIQELHSDESEPEFMFQDVELETNLLDGFVVELETELLDGFVSEYWLSEDVYKAIELIEKSNVDSEVLEAFANCSYGAHNNLEGLEKTIKDCDEAYVGKFDSDVDFVQQLLDDIEPDIADNPLYNYVDWEHLAREYMWDFNTSNGYYFRNV